VNQRSKTRFGRRGSKRRLQEEYDKSIFELRGRTQSANARRMTFVTPGGREAAGKVHESAIIVERKVFAQFKQRFRSRAAPGKYLVEIASQCNQ